MFSNVLKKFFTGREEYENKAATEVRETKMAQEIKAVFERNHSTLLLDAIGGVALCVSFVFALYLPGLF
ncbi:hypothetical protein SAMN05216224_10611 [Thioclava dalianensis]|nr:hypothetical protein SAMN05216224_10611 [Thioclava dalianensis]